MCENQYADCWTYPKEKIDELIKEAIEQSTPIVVAGGFSASTGVSLTDSQVLQTGKVATVYLRLKLSASIGSSAKNIGTITGIPKIKKAVIVPCLTGTAVSSIFHPALATINTSGAITVTASTTSDTYILINATYIIN